MRSTRVTAKQPSAGSGQQAYARGRASAATLALTPPPTRRWVLGLAVVALLAAIGGAVLAVNWPRESPKATPELPPPVIVSVVPEPRTSPAGPAPTTPSSSPKPTPTLDFEDAVSRFRSAIEDGAAGGDIRSDVATDFLNLLQPLTDADRADLGTRVDALRRKINDRAGEGSVSPAQVALLRSRLADLDRAAGT